MIVRIFYSWQSDLPSNKNRGLIENCINLATKELIDLLPKVTEFRIETDSRNDIGTPDLAESIFNKINTCDIFIADISIVNPETKYRKSPNPNVLFELGYASKAIGWSNILCIFNLEHGIIEELPFDIRFRKPIVYTSNTEKKPQEKQNLTKIIKNSLFEMINSKVIDKKEYETTKRTVDLHMQSILLDFCTLLYENSEKKNEKYNYPRLLSSSKQDIEFNIRHSNLLGFHLFKNIGVHINDLITFFNDEFETYFLSDKEKRLLAKIVFTLRNYRQFIYSDRSFLESGKNDQYYVKNAYEINKTNPKNSFLLLSPLKNDKAVVIAGGKFEEDVISKLLTIYNVSDQSMVLMTQIIYEIVSLVNDWIELTGNYFVFNEKEIIINHKL